MKVRLTTNGEFVHDAIIPPFNMAPDVLTWGIRTFINAGTMDGDRHVYREAFAVAIIDAFQPPSEEDVG